MVNEFTTTDFWLAAYLKAKGLKIMAVRPPSNRAIFVFEDSAERPAWVKDFYNNCFINIGNFKMAFQDLKASIYNLKER